MSFPYPRRPAPASAGELGQLLLRREDRFEQISMRGDALEHVAHLEDETVGIGAVDVEEAGE